MLSLPMLMRAGSVRFQFFTAFGLIAVLLWGAIAFALHSAEREAMEKASADGRNLARSLAEHVASSVRAIDLVLLHLRAELLESSEPAAARVAREQEYLKLEFVSQVTLVDAGGRIAWASLPGWQGVDVSDRPHFKVLKQRGADGLYISEPMFGRVSQQWTIQFTRPIYDGHQKFAGVLVLSVLPPALERVYNDIQLGEGGAIALVRSDGQILAHSRDLAKAATVSLAEEPGLGANDPPAGEFRVKAKVDGLERLYRYQKVPGYPLTVFVGQSTDTVLTPYRAQRAIYLASGALATVLLLAVTLLLISRRIDKEGAERNRAQLAAIVQDSNDAIVGLDRDARIVSWNAGAERLYGYTEAEAVGQLISMTVPPDRFSEFAALPRRIFQGERVPHFETVRVAKDGRRIDVLLCASPIKNTEGSVVGISIIAQDITELKRAEEEVRRLNEGLEQKVKERTRELERANEELGAFSYSVAHELRTPLRGINGFSAILAREYAGKLDAIAQGCLQRIQAASIRMGDLMDDLLALAHAGKAELLPQELDLSAMAHAVAATRKNADPRRQVEFVIAPGMAAYADPELVRIALDNLFGNAWKFTSRCERARIEFGLTTAEGKPAFFVRDNGIGFDPAFSRKLFKQFERLHTGKEYEGTGVGLAIVARVIRRHGGRIWAEGAVGQGATFYFTLG